MCACMCARAHQKQRKQKAGEAVYEALNSSVTKTPRESPGVVAAMQPFDQSDREENPALCNTVFFQRKMPGPAKCPVDGLYLC